MFFFTPNPYPGSPWFLSLFFSYPILSLSYYFLFHFSSKDHFFFLFILWSSFLHLSCLHCNFLPIFHNIFPSSASCINCSSIFSILIHLNYSSSICNHSSSSLNHHHRMFSDLLIFFFSHYLSFFFICS